VCVADGQSALRLGTRLGLYRNAAPRRVVVNHPVVVVPEHVLWWCGALQCKSKPFNTDANVKLRHEHNRFYATGGRDLLKD
jgi:hypothetical protein